jgi:hypothetical protein
VLILVISANFVQLLELVKSLVADDAPFIINGGVALFLYLKDINYHDIFRTTTDIDFSVTNPDLSLDKLLESINCTVADVVDPFFAKITKNYPDSDVVTVTVYNNYTRAIYLRMDITFNTGLISKQYLLDNTVVNAVVPLEVLADKLLVLSSRTILRRPKDLVDIFVLSNCLQFKFCDLINLQTSKNRIFGPFKEFFSFRVKLEENYGLLKGVSGKPEFHTIYKHLCEFIEPFFLDFNEAAKLSWTPKHKKWISDLDQSLNQEISKTKDDEPTGPKPR